MLPPGGGTNSVDPRFLSLFSMLNIVFPSQENVERIYNSILKEHFRSFDEEVKNFASKITQATIKLYNDTIVALPRTPIKFHYIFNLRDLSRVYEGLCRSTIDKVSNSQSIIRLWRNECLRVFGDRLLSFEDRALINEKFIPDLIREFFPDHLEYVM